MIDTAKAVLLEQPKPSLNEVKKNKKKKPPAYRQNKHLRRAPSQSKVAWTFIKAGLQPKVLAKVFGVFAVLTVIAGWIGYTSSTLEPLEITDFNVLRPNWTSEPYVKNNFLQYARRIRKVKNLYPTALATDKSENLYVATSDGAIIRIKPSSKGKMAEGKFDIIHRGPVNNATLPFEYDGELNGHPVAMSYNEGTKIIFGLDSWYGLYAFSVDIGKSTSLASITPNKTGIFTPTDLDMTHSFESIYITDFSSKWSDYYMMNEILEGSCTGRLLKYDFASQSIQVVMNGLCGPVGVQLVLNETTVLVTEVVKPRIRIVEINGTAPRTTRFIPLPGFPGKIRRNPRGGCWIPMTKVNTAFFDFVNPRPWLRKTLAGILPQSFLKSLATMYHTLVIEVDPQGEVVEALHDMKEEKLYELREVQEGRRGQLLFASDQNEYIAKLVGGDSEESSHLSPPGKIEEEILGQDKDEDLVFDPANGEDVGASLVSDIVEEDETVEEMNPPIEEVSDVTGDSEQGREMNPPIVEASDAQGKDETGKEMKTPKVETSDIDRNGDKIEKMNPTLEKVEPIIEEQNPGESEKGNPEKKENEKEDQVSEEIPKEAVILPQEDLSDDDFTEINNQNNFVPPQNNEHESAEKKENQVEFEEVDVSPGMEDSEEFLNALINEQKGAKRKSKVKDILKQRKTKKDVKVPKEKTVEEVLRQSAETFQRKMKEVDEEFAKRFDKEEKEKKDEL